MQNKISFGSDNYAPAHPLIVARVLKENKRSVPAYGHDPTTKAAIAEFKKQFGQNSEIFFVFTGTAANVAALSGLVSSYEAIICTDIAHINTHECAAPEKNIGCKIWTVKNKNGKLTIPTIKRVLHSYQDQHHAQPRAISITQPTEYGTVYTLEEIKALTDFAHAHNMLVHMDGARLANAAAALGCSLKATTRDVGIDVLSFGGTKNGLLFGEAVVFLNTTAPSGMPYIIKQQMQLASKMRFIAAQFLELFKKDLWLHNATHANSHAQKLAEKMKNLPQLKIAYPVETNAIFFTAPKKIIRELQKEFAFYVWDERRMLARIMTSFITSDADINKFIGNVQQ